ncbi:transposase [Paenibacillus brasilensis]|uniref:Transposase n=1 Tax=Paenibacillus brasilensis TaxID=128574 RepID=A0ABU0KZM3_9BACL|nr:transposase [Paenibacillus brasilensis]
MAMTEEEIITALVVTPGSTDDGKQLPVLLEQATANGVSVNEIMADKAYSSKGNLAKMKTENISPMVPLHPIVHEGGERQATRLRSGSSADRSLNIKMQR